MFLLIAGNIKGQLRIHKPIQPIWFPELYVRDELSFNIEWACGSVVCLSLTLTIHGLKMDGDPSFLKS